MRPSVNISLSHRSLAAAFLAAMSPWTTVSMLQAGEGSGSTVDIAQREIIRRQQRMAQASEEEEAGDKAMSERDYQGGLTHYRAALDLLPDAEIDRVQRDRVIGKFVDTSIKLAQQRAEGGEYAAARNLLEVALSYDPDKSLARRLLQRLDDPEWFNPANSKEHMTNVQEVKKHLELGLGAFDLGDFDKARDEFNHVLAIDRYNTAARRQLERTERRISEHHLASRDHTRADMLRRVDEQWETAVPALTNVGAGSGLDLLGGGIDSSQVILEKMKTLIIPSVALEQATVEEAVEFLRLKSRELDTSTVDPARRGVNFILRLAATGPTPKITSLNLTNVPLSVAVKAVADMAGLRSRVEPYAVIISPADTETELYTKVFRVPPDFLSLQGSGAAGEVGAGADPFATGGATGGAAAAPARPRATAIDILKSAGITFPEQGTAFFSAATSTLTVRNNPANLDLVSQFIESISNKVAKMIKITSKFIEVNQKNTDEFGFDWLLGAFNIGGDRVFGSGGTAGNRSAGPIGANNWPLVPPGQAGTPLPVGGSNLLTGGLRFGDNAISNNAIDGLLSTSANAEGTPEASVTPAVFGVSGVFTDPQFQTVLRALNQKKGTDLLTAPSVTTRSGQRAKVEVIREFIYPTEFEPPEIPQDFGGGLTVGGAAGAGGQSSGFPVTPTTPTAFETRNTGVTLEVEPTLGADGYTIDLTLAPEVVEFEGFINYGSPIQSSATDALGNPTTIVLTENRIEQPVFSTRKLSTSVTIWDGMTLGVGGLISDSTQTVEDKVPIMGDVPYFGRFFRTKSDQFFKKNLMMFVTVDLIDPSGQKVNANKFINTGLDTPPPTGPEPALMPDIPPDNLK